MAGSVAAEAASPKAAFGGRHIVMKSGDRYEAHSDGGGWPMNSLIRYSAEAGLTSFVYNTFLALSFVGWLAFNLCSGRHYGIPVWKRVVVSAVIWPVAYGLLYVLFWIESSFTRWGSHNIVRGFIYFPLIALALGKLLHIRGRTITDYIAPGVSLSQGIAHIGCSFAGCCYGFPAERGIWNPKFETCMVPNQMMETAAALLVFAVCALYAKKRRYDSDGRVYPIFLILFGVTRFFPEYLRDNQKVFANISILALHCIGMVIVGTVWLLIRNGKENRDSSEKGANEE